ncbi:MAG: polysaccharide deacetylase family protein [Thermoleophilaceae bacterium]
MRGPRHIVLLLLAVSLAGCAGGTSSHPAHPVARSGAAAARVAEPMSARAAIERLLRTGRPVYCGGDRPYAALTFDDGPGVYTALGLRILRKAHVPATFFLVGRNLRRFGPLARRDAAAGSLGNHTWDHPMLTGLQRAAVDSELSRTDAAIRRDTGVTPELFRPPYEARNAAVDATARHYRLLEILWNVDSRDSEGAGWKQIAHHVLTGMSPGAIVLMHENRGQTIRALKFVILPALARRHIRLVTVPQLLADDPPSAREVSRGRIGCRYHAAVSSGS